jgi:acetyl esterase/lipase
MGDSVEIRIRDNGTGNPLRRPTTLPSRVSSMATLVVVLLVGNASAADYEVKTQPGLVYVEHDGTKLVGDFYLPKDRAKAPAVVALHGGGWQAGSRAFYNYWGPFLARNGYALFAVDYRLAKQGTYPAAVYDAKAAIQFVRAKAAEFDIDPDRIALMGDSAGGILRRCLRSPATNSPRPTATILTPPSPST